MLSKHCYFIVILLLNIVPISDSLLLYPMFSIEYTPVKIAISYDKLELNIENVLMVAKDMGILHDSIAVRQAIIETGWFKSKNARQHNNLFGMRVPGRRKTYAIGKTKAGYAIYKHWSYSIADYKLWQDMKVIKGCYYKYLVSRGYASDKNYIRKLKGVRL